MKKRGQVAIFIIVAVVIISAVVALFLFVNKGSLIPRDVDAEDPSLFLKNCIEEDLMYTIETLSYQGGSINPELALRFKFDNEDYKNISYLCYTRDYYAPCISQQPALINHEKQEIRNEIEEKVEECYNMLVRELEKDYSVSSRYEGFDIDLTPDYTEIRINGSLNYERGEKKFSEKNFDLRFATKFYELIMLAQEISNQEAVYCYFDRVGYQLYYPDIEIEAPFRLDDEKIYTLRHTKTKEIFRFAIRSCAIPEGLM